MICKHCRRAYSDISSWLNHLDSCRSFRRTLSASLAAPTFDRSTRLYIAPTNLCRCCGATKAITIQRFESDGSVKLREAYAYEVATIDSTCERVLNVFCPDCGVVYHPRSIRDDL